MISILESKRGSYNQALVNCHSKASFEKNCFSAWASTLNMGLINKVDMICLSPVGYCDTQYPTGDKHAISTLLIKPIFL